MNTKLSTKATVAAFICIIATWLGLVVVYKYLSHDENRSKLLSTIPVTRKPVSLTLKLSSPDNNILVYDSDLLVSGMTIPGATVVLSTNSGDQVIDMGSNGEFSKVIKLEEGVNRLVIASFDSQENSKVESRTVYYSKEKI